MSIADHRFALIALVLLLALGPAHAEPPPAAAFGSLPAIGDASLSPSGERLAWSDQSGQDAYVSVIELTSGKVIRKIAVGAEYKLRGLEWADDKTMLMNVSQTERAGSIDDSRYRLEFYRTIAVDLQSGKASIMLMAGGARGLVNSGRIEALHTGRANSIVMSSLDFTANAARGVVDSRLKSKATDSGWVHVLFEVDTRTGNGKALERGSVYTDQWVVDATGRGVARSDWNPEGYGYRIQVRQGSSWKDIFNRPKGPTLLLSGVNAAGTAIVAVGLDERKKGVAYEIALDGSGARVLYEHPERDVVGVVKDRFTGVPAALALDGPERERHWIDAAAKARHDAVARSFKGARVAIYNQSRDGKRVLARVDGPSRPGVYYLIDYNKRTADIVGEEYPALANAKLGTVQSIRYAARDGQQIPAFLTLPPDSDGKNLPMVVLPHGGPNMHDDNGFDWWPQFLATRGYAVLQPQFRGSTGFGQAFEEAGYRQWGLLMQDDVTDGVRAMVAQGVAHPARICIVGASYGGYAALAGVAFTPDLYRCAVSYAGISSIPQMLAADRTRWGEDSSSYIELVRRVGDPLDPRLLAQSPISAVERIVAPVLLIHGLDDIIVPPAQSESLARAMANRGRLVNFVKLEGEDHYLSRSATRQRLLVETEKFLAEHLPR